MSLLQIIIFTGLIFLTPIYILELNYGYKIIMGTFLVVFVPQKCGDEICSMTDNFFNGTIINSAGNICNFVTFSSIGTLYFIEMRRENWCIKQDYRTVGCGYSSYNSCASAAASVD